LGVTGGLILSLPIMKLLLGSLLAVRIVCFINNLGYAPLVYSTVISLRI
jgi:hypothetical protein